jgi:hypothetical protein
MHRCFGVLTGLALAMAVCGGCDDRDSDKQGGNSDRQKTTAAMSSARYGVGWHTVAESHLSSWSFSPTPPAGRMLVSQSTASEHLAGDAGRDALAGIRTALMANMLPAHGSVHIEALVNRALATISPLPSETAPDKPMIVLATTPWNDESLLLWVEVPGLSAPEAASVGVEFDPSAVAAFRALGDPAAMPSPDAPDGVATGRAAMLYELLPQRTDAPAKGGAAKLIVKYGILHVAGTSAGQAKLEQPITTADAVGTIDNAPDIVRFATATAGFGGLLRGDPAMRDLSCNDVIALAQSVRQPDADGWRAQMIALMYRAEPLIDLPPAR